MKTLALFIPLLVLLSGSDAVTAASDHLPRSHPKYRTAKRVYDDLVRAIGDGRTAPRLYVQPRGVSSRMKAAWYSAGRNTLTVEERLYDLCVSLGPDSLNALAALLGHELAHYYKDHAWPGDFGNGFADLAVGQSIAGLRSSVASMEKIETEADYFGGFCGYVAGYNTLGVAASILEAVYLEYELSDDLPGYPALSERQEIAHRSLRRLHKLVPVFEAGNRLLLISKYEEASRCFDHIARDFPSREILNNAGVARALQAMALFETGELRFAYPLELDPTTRLRGGRKAAYGSIDERIDHRSELLSEAAGFFDQARSRDPQYTAAYTNTACVADMQGDHDEALFFASKAVKSAGRRDDQPVSLSNALIARGIACAHGDPADEECALRDFSAAQDGNQLLASLNLAALSSSAPAAADSASVRVRLATPETIGELSAAEASSIMDDPDARTSLPKLNRSQPAIDIFVKRAETWSSLAIDTGYSTITFLETENGYTSRSARGLSIGQQLEDVLEAYGSPTGHVSGSRSIYHIYEPARVIFLTAASGRVMGWMTYAVDE